MNKKGLLKLVEYELRTRSTLSKETDRNLILNLYQKLKKQNLSHDEIIRKIVLEFKGFDEDYWKQKIERILFSEGLVDDATFQNTEKIFNTENLLSKNVLINQKKETLAIGKIVKMRDKIGIVVKVIPSKVNG